MFKISLKFNVQSLECFIKQGNLELETLHFKLCTLNYEIR